MKSRRVFKKVVPVMVAVGIMLLASGMVAQTVWSATDYPTKNITLIVPFAPGGNSDASARLLAEYLKKQDVKVIVVNRPGGACTIAGNETVEAPKDGYTLLQVSGSVLWQPIYEQTKYDYSVDLDAVANLTEGQYGYFVQGKSPWKSIADLVAYAKQNPGKVKFGHSAYGGPMHLVGSILAKRAGIEMVQVPFKGMAESIPALLGGHVQLMCEGIGGLQEFIKSGDMRLLATSGNERFSFYPEIPSIKELGYPVGIYAREGIGAPKGIPPDVRAKLAAMIKKVHADPTYVDKLRKQVQEVVYYGPEELQKKWQEFVTNNRAMTKEIGIYDEIRKANK